MSLDLTLYLCEPPDSGGDAFVHAKLPLNKGDGFVVDLDKKLPEKPLNGHIIVGDSDEREPVRTTPYGDPLTYVLPSDLVGLAPGNPGNQAALAYIQGSRYREGSIVVLYWR